MNLTKLIWYQYPYLVNVYAKNMPKLLVLTFKLCLVRLAGRDWSPLSQATLELTLHREEEDIYGEKTMNDCEW